MERGIAMIISFACLLPLVALRAWALSTVWNWYLPPALGAPAITFAGAVGVSLIVAFLTHDVKASETPKDEAVAKTVNAIISHTMMPLIVVACAWTYLAIWPLS